MDYRFTKRLLCRSPRSLPLMLLVTALMAGCSSGEHADLQAFMAEARAKPSGEIDPLPTFHPFKTFKYSAVAMRSPFDPPLQAVSPELGAGKAAVKPDERRKKEYLEGFNFASLSMVGTLSKDGTMWGLVNDGQGGIHRVKAGNYLGKNHGRIVAIAKTQLDLIEIVPDGRGGWVERPRTLALKEN